MELQDEVNAMISSLQRFVQKDRTLVEHLSSRIDEVLKRLSDSPTESDIGQIHEDLKSLKEELQHLTQRFKV